LIDSIFHQEIFRKLEKVKLVIQNLNSQEIELNIAEKSIIFYLAEAGVDWMQTCGQKGRCTTCAFEIINGAENLSEYSDNELKFRSLDRLPENYRLACQTKIYGNVEIRVPESLKLPHIKYSS